MRQKSATQFSGVPRVSRSRLSEGAIIAEVMFVRFAKPPEVGAALNVMQLRHAKAASSDFEFTFSKKSSSISFIA